MYKKIWTIFNSKLATLLAWLVLRCGNWPGRRIAGIPYRLASRWRGGKGFKVISKDGTKLAAWHIPKRAGPGAISNNTCPSLPSIIITHGWLELKELHFKRAQDLAGRGHDVILFDHRAHGASRGTVTTFGIRESEDLCAVLDDAYKKKFIQGDVIAIGYSMGAATALQYAGQDKRICAVVAFVPFNNLTSAIISFRNLLAPWMSGRWLLKGFKRATKRAGFALNKVSTVKAIKKLNKPVLIIEAGKDKNLPPKDHIAPLIEAKTKGKLEHLVIPQASHMSICRKKWDNLDEKIYYFLDSNKITIR